MTSYTTDQVNKTAAALLSNRFGADEETYLAALANGRPENWAAIDAGLPFDAVRPFVHRLKLTTRGFFGAPLSDTDQGQFLGAVYTRIVELRSKAGATSTVAHSAEHERNVEALELALRELGENELHVVAGYALEMSSVDIAFASDVSILDVEPTVRKALSALRIPSPLSVENRGYLKEAVARIDGAVPVKGAPRKVGREPSVLTASPVEAAAPEKSDGSLAALLASVKKKPAGPKPEKAELSPLAAKVKSLDRKSRMFLVASAIVRGLKTAAIAAELDIAGSTVENVKTKLYKHLGMSDIPRGERPAVLRAAFEEAGLVELETEAAV